MVPQMTIEEAIEYIQDDETNDDFSFRGDNCVPKNTFNNSWYHGDDDSEFNLGGVSAIAVTSYAAKDIYDAAIAAKRYGKNLFLLRGSAMNAHEWANDPGECLMSEHKIVGIVTLNTDATHHTKG